MVCCRSLLTRRPAKLALGQKYTRKLGTINPYSAPNAHPNQKARQKISPQPEEWLGQKILQKHLPGVQSLKAREPVARTFLYIFFLRSLLPMIKHVPRVIES